MQAQIIWTFSLWPLTPREHEQITLRGKVDPIPACEDYSRLCRVFASVCASMRAVDLQYLSMYVSGSVCVNLFAECVCVCVFMSVHTAVLWSHSCARSWAPGFLTVRSGSCWIIPVPWCGVKLLKAAINCPFSNKRVTWMGPLTAGCIASAPPGLAQPQGPLWTGSSSQAAVTAHVSALIFKWC